MILSKVLQSLEPMNTSGEEDRIQPFCRFPESRRKGKRRTQRSSRGMERRSSTAGSTELFFGENDIPYELSRIDGSVFGAATEGEKVGRRKSFLFGCRFTIIPHFSVDALPMNFLERWRDPSFPETFCPEEAKSSCPDPGTFRTCSVWKNTTGAVELPNVRRVFGTVELV